MSITIHLEEPILPPGARITAEIKLGYLSSGLKELSAAVDYIHEESDTSRDTSPGERALIKRLDAIEKAILDGLPPKTKLAIANEVNGI